MLPMDVNDFENTDPLFRTPQSKFNCSDNYKTPPRNIVYKQSQFSNTKTRPLGSTMFPTAQQNTSTTSNLRLFANMNCLSPDFKGDILPSAFDTPIHQGIVDNQLNRHLHRRPLISAKRMERPFRMWDSPHAFKTQTGLLGASPLVKFRQKEKIPGVFHPQVDRSPPYSPNSSFMSTSISPISSPKKWPVDLENSPTAPPIRECSTIDTKYPRISLDLSPILPPSKTCFKFKNYQHFIDSMEEDSETDEGF